MDNKKENILGIKLRRCRKNCNLSQQQVADTLGINRTTYTYYESGRFEPSLTTISKLAQIFCVDVSQLLPSEAPESPLSDTTQEIINPIYSLTKDEQNLILAFRLLDDSVKSKILDEVTKMSDNKQ